MIRHEKYEDNPSNSRKSVLDFVLARFDSNNDEVPELLSKFITLLGNEKEDWEGLRAIKVCREEFSIWKKGNPKLNGGISTVDDFEEFLFSPDRNVIVIAIQEPQPDPSSASRAVVPGADDPPPKLKTLKGPDTSGTSKAVIPGAAADPPPKLETLKGPGHPSSSKAIISGAVDPPPKLEKLKGPDNPSTSKKVTQVAVGETSVPPANPKTLKVKIYMGTGWDIDFPKLKSPPSLFVNLGIHSGVSQKTKVQNTKFQRTKVQEKTKTPCWGDEFVFPLSSLKGAELIVEVYHKHKFEKLFENKFAGKFCTLVSALKPGIQVIPLSSEEGRPCSSARLLVRIMLY